MTSSPEGVWVRGLGALSPAGMGGAACGSAAQRPRVTSTCSPLVHHARLDLEALADLLPNRKVRRLLSRSVHYGLVAALLALRDAGSPSVTATRLGVFASGLNCLDDVTHLHALLAQIRRQGLDYRQCFGQFAVERLPPFMLLRCLPNAAFCHIAQHAGARGYNATLMTGPASGLDCLRHATLALRNRRLDAALVVSCESAVSWMEAVAMDRVAATGAPPTPMVLGEGAAALYLERGGGDGAPAYACVVDGAAGQAPEGLALLDPGPLARPRSLPATVERVTARALQRGERGAVAFLELGGAGVDWWDQAERSAARLVPDAEVISTAPATGYLGTASGALGLAHLCQRLRSAPPRAAGLVVRAALTGQCAAALLASPATPLRGA